MWPSLSGTKSLEVSNCWFVVFTL